MKSIESRADCAKALDKMKGDITEVIDYLVNFYKAGDMTTQSKLALATLQIEHEQIITCLNSVSDIIDRS